MGNFNWWNNSKPNGEVFEGSENPEMTNPEVEVVCEDVHNVEELEEHPQENSQPIKTVVSDEEAKPEKKAEPVNEQQIVDYTKIGDLLKDPLRILNNNILATKGELKQLTEQITKLEDQNKQQQQVIQKYQSDITEKIKHPLFMELIQLGDGVRNIIGTASTVPVESNNYNGLLNEIIKLERWIDDILCDNGVRRFQTLNADEFNPKRQVITQKQYTDEIYYQGKVASLSPGYEWTLPYLIINSDVKLAKVAQENNVPQKFTYVIRPEEVVLFDKDEL